MNPSTAQARVVVDELVRNGVRHVVLSPGSRNAPLSFALYEAADAGRLRLHVRIDERSASFLALGLAAQSRRPVVVCSTSGTAAANFHPAVLEADRSGVPLVVLTADRPPELRAAGANQVVDQHRLYGGAVRLFAELAVAERRPGQNSYWRSEVCRAWHAARGDWWTTAGPVHLNMPFRDPLVPEPGDGPGEWCESLEGRRDGLPWTEVTDHFAAPSLVCPGEGRGVVLVCEGQPRLAVRWAEEHGWPVLSEAGGVGLGGPNAISTGAWLLGIEEFLAEHHPDQVVCVGRPTVFRQVQRLLADPDVDVYLVHDGNDWPAPGHDVREVGQALGAPFGERDPEWLAAWQAAEKAASVALHAALDAQPWPTGLHVAREVVDALPPGAMLVLGSSNPTRDVALAAHPRPDVLLLRNRGVAGIDGMVSTAVGAALGHQGPAYALLGDLTFLHDSNGLLIGPDEDRPDLTIVVFNDDGGGIFSLLEQGAPEHARPFERVFGTPHGVRLSALCAAHGVPHVAATTQEELRDALRPAPGLRVVEVRADRSHLRELHQRVRSAVRAALVG